VSRLHSIDEGIMPVAFVMPCLNEEEMVEAASCSLGFGFGAAPAASDVYLVLVDNGSTDGTLAIMKQIADQSRKGSVAIIEEPIKGFVPPRRCGALFVKKLAHAIGAPVESWLVLQVDADTVYLPGYAQWMQSFLGTSTGVLLEGAAKRDPKFDRAHPAYHALEQEIDAPLKEAPVADEDEIVVDDKICGYLLSDYLRWGGHFREYDQNGSEVHAETTRLLLRARLEYGAVKVRVNPAQAISSRRRIKQDPVLHFATAGFPREKSWLGRWCLRFPVRRSLDVFTSNGEDAELQEARFYRGAHNIALFWLLPWLIRRAREGSVFVAPDERTARLLSLVSYRTTEQIAVAPASVLIDVLEAIEKYPMAFQDT
jgi:hypothetical protein